MKLAIVIIHYNTSADLDRCLESISAYPPGSEHRVVIVDNASRDDGLDAVHRRYPDHTWIFSEENLGYARGCNLGMAQVEADYYLVLNPDIVVQPGALDRLLEFADRHPRAGLVGPQLLNEDGSIQDSCRRFYTFKTLLLRRTFLGKLFSNSETERRYLMADFDHRSVRPVDWVIGGCVLVRRSAMARTGPMDERFFLYFEDVDWCYRMWQAGYEVIYTPDARFMHRHRRDSARGTFNRTFWMHLGSLISFYEKWGMVVWLLKKWREPLVVMFLWLLDILGVATAFVGAYGLRKMSGVFFSGDLYPFAEYRPLLYFSLLLVSLTFLLTGRYAVGRGREAPPLGAHLQRMVVVGLLLLASTYLGHLEVASRVVLILFLALLTGLTLAGESLFHRLLLRLERGYLSLERTLLVGDPTRLRSWLDGAGDLRRQGVDVAGYLADPPDPGSGLPALGAGDVPWLGLRRELLEVVGRYRISQVVFWEAPGQDHATLRALAGLRRLRIRLRWHVPDAWLLAAGASPEIFGGELGGVQQFRSVTALRVLADRGLSLAVGLALALVGLLPGLWLLLGGGRGDRARWQTVQVRDVWGNDPSLQLAVRADGRVLPLFWQGRLVGPLLRGRLNVYGPRPQLDNAAATPQAAAEIVAFWQGTPRAPGLTGAWAHRNSGVDAKHGAAHTVSGGFAAWRQFWSDPGGFGRIEVRSTMTTETTQPSEGERS